MPLTRRTAIGGLAALGLPLAVSPISASARGGVRADSRRLRFPTPAGSWLEALPVGNGRIGAMIHGNVNEERIPLNHIELWSGHPAGDDRAEALTALPEVRRLLFAGRYPEANALAQARMMTPMDQESYGSYQMLGELRLTLDHRGPVRYGHRELDLETGEVVVEYAIGAHRYRRTILCSFPDAVLAIRLTTTDPAGLDATIGLSRAQDAVIARGPVSAELRGRPEPHGTTFAADLACTSEDGIVAPLIDGFRITGARGIIILLAAGTDLLSPDPAARVREAIAVARTKSWKALVAGHRADYQPLYRAVALELGGSPRAIDTQATASIERQFNFGRYLLIASSRPGSLPANLQGLWADGFAPPWSADYHLNINLQMNYWPAETCGLGALHESLFEHAERLLVPGTRTARIAYGCGGAAAHYTSNPWGHTALDGELQWGMWPEGLAWLSLHFWEHYLYTRDRNFLSRRALPMLSACAIFTLDYLVVDPATGRLVAGPATSPENSYRLPDGQTGEITMGPAMSQSIAYAVLGRCRDATAILGEQTELGRRCDEAIARLQRLRIGADGRILEWPEPFRETDVGHRHISHLFGLYPGYEIDAETAPELARAADLTIAARLAGGGGQTGWSAAWLAMFRARLRQGDAAHAMLVKLLDGSTAPNGFDTHPSGRPEPWFQIDGNLGATAAIVEMLMQSHDDRLCLLPALPSAWPDGHVAGLRARGCLAVDIVWRAGLARRVTLRPEIDVRYRIVAPRGQRIARMIEDGLAVGVQGPDFLLRAGRIYRLRFASVGGQA